MAVDIDSSFSENRVINVPVGRILCSRKWMNSHLVATMKGYINNLRIINNSRSRAAVFICICFSHCINEGITAVQASG